MGSAKIQLPGFVVADLFRGSLVVLDELKPVGKILQEPDNTVSGKKKSSGQAPEKQGYLGTNGKNITILVNDPTAVYLNDTSLQFLSAILVACKLNLGDVAIVNLHHQHVGYAVIKEITAPQYALVFNISPEELQLPFVVSNYQVQLYDQCRFLLAPSLEAMQGNSQDAKLEKSKLWISLKKMFHL